MKKNHVPFILAKSEYKIKVWWLLIYEAEKDEAGKEEAYVVGSDSASRVTRHKLELHVNLPKQILLLGLETRSRGFVKGEGEKLSIVEYLASAITPCDVEVLVEVTGRGKNYHRQHNQQHKY